MKKSLAVLGLLSLLMAVPVSASAALTSTQVNAIISLLQSFGASQSVVNGVKDVLLGEDNPSELASLEVRILNGNAQCVTTPCEVTYNKYVEVTVYQPGSRELLKKLSTNTGKVTFYDLPVGSYIVDVRGKESQALGTATVSVGKELKVDVVVKESASATPSITVISPNGGESFGSKDKFDANYYGVNLSDRVNAYLFHDERGNVMTSVSVIAGAHGTGKGMVSFDLGLNKIPAGQYRINLCDPNNSPVGLPGKDLCDMSDGYFTILSAPSLAVTYPNGGETIMVGGDKDADFRVEWAAANVTGNVYVSLDFLDGDACLIKSNIPVSQGFITARLGSYYNCPNINRQLTDGKYKVLIGVLNNPTLKDKSDDSFFVVNSTTTTNKAPVISTFSGPTTIKPYAAGTWRIRASDPEGKKLTYDINWGEGVATTTGSLPSNGSLSITHKYKKVGQYRINLVITDADRGLASKSLVVNVTSSGQAAAGSASRSILERLGNWFSR